MAQSSFDSTYKELHQLIKLYIKKICLEHRKRTPMDIQISHQIEMVYEDLFQEFLQVKKDCDENKIGKQTLINAYKKIKFLTQLLLELWK